MGSNKAIESGKIETLITRVKNRQLMSKNDYLEKKLLQIIKL